jgi:hypothetical protein
VVEPERPWQWDAAGFALGLGIPACTPAEYAAWMAEVEARGEVWSVPVEEDP